MNSKRSIKYNLLDLVYNVSRNLHAAAQKSTQKYVLLAVTSPGYLSSTVQNNEFDPKKAVFKFMCSRGKVSLCMMHDFVPSQLVWRPIMVQYATYRSSVQKSETSSAHTWCLDTFQGSRRHLVSSR